MNIQHRIRLVESIGLMDDITELFHQCKFSKNTEPGLYWTADIDDIDNSVECKNISVTKLKYPLNENNRVAYYHQSDQDNTLQFILYNLELFDSEVDLISTCYILSEIDLNLCFSYLVGDNYLWLSRNTCTIIQKDICLIPGAIIIFAHMDTDVYVIDSREYKNVTYFTFDDPGAVEAFIDTELSARK